MKVPKTPLFFLLLPLLCTYTLNAATSSLFNYAAYTGEDDRVRIRTQRRLLEIDIDVSCLSEENARDTSEILI